MNDTGNLLQFMREQSGKIWSQLLAHVGLTFLSLLIAICIALPLGILISRRKKLAGFVLGIVGTLQTIPSIALLGFMIPLLGIGILPAVVALFLYALLPIVRNTYTGILGVPFAVTDAAKGMGMTPKQILFKVEMPLAFPVILAGIRTATVINVGVATLAAYIAAGGLGEFIFGGIALNNTNMILAGALPAALLAILLDFLLSRLQKLKPAKWKLVAVWLPVILLVCCSFYLVPALDKSKLLAGYTPEFMGRNDGYLGLQKVYDLDVKNVVVSDAVMYKAAFEKKLDIISGYSTDGRLKAFDLISLIDDKHIFPPYYVAPVVRQNLLDAHPEIEQVLNMLAGKINDSVMTYLNYEVDHQKKLPEAVAKDFLEKINLYRPSKNGSGQVVRIGSKIFGEQYILCSMYRMLIEGYTNLTVENKTGLGGTKICFDALTNNQIDMYPEYTGTALLAILHTPQQRVDSLSSSKEKVYDFVQAAFTKQYNLKWLKPVGFNNTYALMMRKQQADASGIHTISDLSAYTRQQ